ncbi:hypothetical protein AZ78_1009 [Lysobacter capsici AZ78]|uniref:Uncharacterized protein n=1 Tax=Lysobacter capsici AZ78 TaxID=1444315 RepID=A0A108U6I6_9GAMM|nr:hypothetical protein AZ78_1009 [Lysobacter capsici AZ78]
MHGRSLPARTGSPRDRCNFLSTDPWPAAPRSQRSASRLKLLNQKIAMPLPDMWHHARYKKLQPRSTKR